MAANVKLHNDQFRAFRQSPEMQAAVTTVAQRIADRANGRALHKGARYVAMPARVTGHGSVALATTSRGSNAIPAMIDQAEYKTLSGAVGA